MNSAPPTPVLIRDVVGVEFTKAYPPVAFALWSWPGERGPRLVGDSRAKPWPVVSVVGTRAKISPNVIDG